MRFLILFTLATILAACSVLHPFGNATDYRPWYVSSPPGLQARYDCLRETLSGAGYEVELITPARDTPNVFDISKGGERISQADMTHHKGERMIAITLISGSKRTNEALGQVIKRCVQ